MSARAPERELPLGLMVLVVEDEFLIAMDLEAMLREHGWRVLGPAATVETESISLIVRWGLLTPSNGSSQSTVWILGV